MALPNDGNVDFLVCDAARQEADGKITLSGFYPTGEVQLAPTARLPVTLALTFVFVLRDGAGEFRLTFRLLDPLGKELTRNPLPNLTKPAGRGHAVWVNLGGIPIAALGTYTAELAIDDQRHRRTIRVSQ